MRHQHAASKNRVFELCQIGGANKTRVRSRRNIEAPLAQASCNGMIDTLIEMET
jgi:hypothetical protein